MSGEQDPGRIRRWWQGLRGASYAKIVSALVVALMLVIVVDVGMSLLAAVTGDVYAEPLSVELDPAPVASDLPEGVVAREVTARVDIRAGLGLRLVWWATDGVTAVLVLTFLELLRRITRSGQDPFTSRNLARLRLMAAVPVAYFLASGLREMLGFWLELHHGFDVASAEMTLTPLALTLLILVITEVWSKGNELRDDAELTV